MVAAAPAAAGGAQSAAAVAAAAGQLPGSADAAGLPQGPLWDPLLNVDEGRAYREWLELAREATVVESMLVALGHMQVSVCYLRSARQGPRRGLMPAFHKNIICFPQDLAELRQLQHFFANLRVNDVVNVRLEQQSAAVRPAGAAAAGATAAGAEAAARGGGERAGAQGPGAGLRARRAARAAR